MTVAGNEMLRLAREARLRRGGLLGGLFVLWILMLPFTTVLQQALGTIAADKILGLILLLVWIFRTQSLDNRRIGAIWLYVVLATLFIVTKNLSFLSERRILYPNLWEDAVHMGYFMLPILYIRHIHDLRRVNNAIIIVAIIGYISAFLVAMGIISLPAERISASRFGFALPKTVGLFSSYGDLAQFTAYTLALTVFVPRENYFAGFGNRIVKLGVFATAVIGFSASQSRNILLSTVIALAVTFVLSRMIRKRRGFAGYAALISVVIVVTALAVFFGTELTSGIAGLGGGSGRSTAATRLEQYAMAYGIFADSPLLGASAETFAKFGIAIKSTHNMWFSLAAQGGAIAVVVLLALIVRSIATAAPLLRNPVASREALAIFAYFVALMLSVQFYPGQTSMFWVLLGVACSVGAMSPPEESSDPNQPVIAQEH